MWHIFVFLIPVFMVSCCTKEKQNSSIVLNKTDSASIKKENYPDSMNNLTQQNPSDLNCSDSINSSPQQNPAESSAEDQDVQRDTVYCLESDSGIVSLLYPNVAIMQIPNENYDKWFIKVVSLTSSGGFDFMTWSEVNNPAASTQFDEWNWGGIAALENGTLVDTMMYPNLTIDLISDHNTYLSIIAESQGSFHGNVIDDTLYINFENNSFNLGGQSTDSEE